jgi:hypothetical protein
MAELETYVSGKLMLENINVGSKSDGIVVVLITEKNKYKLYRKGTYTRNDSYFFPYENENITIKGQLQQNNWFMVNGILN